MISKPIPALVREIAPEGVLRAALNTGNPILARSNTSSEVPAGVTIDLSREFARHLGVDADLICFKTAAESVAALEARQADIGFMAIDPLRAEGVHFTSAYVEIEGSYAVPADSTIVSNEQVDQEGFEVVVGAGSAYDLFLRRHLAHARMVRIPLSEHVIREMLAHGHAVAAGVRQQLEQEMARVPGARLLPGRFMVIHQASGMPRGRSPEARAHLDAFIEHMKRTGFVADALKRHGIEGAVVAP
jgi:polar amino acid transport system substrate-binding protein